MATETDITEYHKGEYIRILFYAKNRFGAPLPSASAHVVAMTVSETPSGTPIATFDIASGNVQLLDEATAEFLIEIFEDDQTSFVENRTYYYNIWNWPVASPTTQGLQVKGTFILQNSIEP